MQASTTNTEYTPRRHIAQDVKKPVIFPGHLIIKGTPRLLKTIERMCPDEGNRRRESLILAEVWTEKLNRRPTPKSALVALAAYALQATDKAFADQVRMNGKVVTGFSRAKCTMSKTCNWMLTEKLFVTV